MKKTELSKFISHLSKNHEIYAPQERDGQVKLGQNPAKLDGQVFIEELSDPKKAVMDERIPYYSWKKFFVPEKENLFQYKNFHSKPIASLPPFKKGGAGGFLPEKITLLGLNILDLKYVLLYDQVFANDPYYQARRKNILIIAHNHVPKPENNLTSKQYSREQLQHLPFDILLEFPSICHPELVSGSKNLDSRLRPPRLSEAGGNDNERGSNKKSDAIRIFTGSGKGQEVLDNFKYKNYEVIKFTGPLREDQPGSKLNTFRDKLKKAHKEIIWDELGRICLECGKCTIVCPTCFCFRIDDLPDLNSDENSRQRCWDSCYYQEFSEVAGGHKFLNSTSQRIHFWYFHKFARIPDEFGITGCVGCRRCFEVCPVGIDIKEILRQIEEM